MSERVRVICPLNGNDERTLADDVLDGLTRPFKELAPKHFYDKVGGELFDQICDLPEYYPTRAERSIFEAHGAEIVAASGMAELVELGSGTAEKTMILIDQAAAAGMLQRYVPFDVTETMVRRCSEICGERFTDAEIIGVVGDFERHLGYIPPPIEGAPRVVALLGGTIGNFVPGSRRQLLRAIASLLRPGIDHLLLGTDLVKDPAVIEAAYNDSAGVTAAFNRNLLSVINRSLDADFDVEAFEHVAFYDQGREWIEMRLRASRAMHVKIAAIPLAVDFASGEEVRTEVSAKFTPERLADDLGAAGLKLENTWTDSEGRFALSLSS
ncbi:MAG: L-histidine N(alpha)-methyltransferase, partial [Solirubrobacteraceae bacterium]|nr:L-histidine N(alpha)-methyltransferase [Solirubrobacteraceae bacterium]